MAGKHSVLLEWRCISTGKKPGFLQPRNRICIRSLEEIRLYEQIVGDLSKIYKYPIVCMGFLIDD